MKQKRFRTAATLRYHADTIWRDWWTADCKSDTAADRVKIILTNTKSHLLLWQGRGINADDNHEDLICMMGTVPGNTLDSFWEKGLILWVHGSNDAMTCLWCPTETDFHAHLVDQSQKRLWSFCDGIGRINYMTFEGQTWMVLIPKDWK